MLAHTPRFQDAVWLIDFATSVELPLFTDLCKWLPLGKRPTCAVYSNIGA